ncbi:MAG: hypothetical protein MK077_06830 [Phycisphaerales bacterium]|nr:hypothetical protein [Phycisphaerales bacterium]
MAKMFYTLDEVCSKLGKTESEVEALVESGQIQEFRDGESLVFKVEQINLLAEPDEAGDVDLDLDDSALDLDDSFAMGESSTSTSLGLAESQSAELPAASTPASEADDSAADSGSVIDLHASASQSSVSPASEVDQLDLSAELDRSGSVGGASASVSAFDSAVGVGGDTQLGGAVEDDLTLEMVGSGSGLLDLTRESDDTSLGAELMEEVFTSDDDAAMPAADSGLFEAETAPAAVAGAAPATPTATPVAAMPMAAQAWDPAWSGLACGLLIGATVALFAILSIVLIEIQGAASGVSSIIAGSLWIWIGGLAGGTAISGVIGFVLGKRGG